MAESKKDISYLNKDFDSLKSYLVNLCKVYFKGAVNDFSANDPATMFIDISSAVGDILSYYQNVNTKEALFLLAEEKKNIVQMAQALGYKPRATFPAVTNLDVYQLIPSIGAGSSVRPDYNYALKLAAGMQVSSDTGVIFRTKNELDFSVSGSYNTTEASIYQVDSGGAPTYYLLKKNIQIESGTQKSVAISVSSPQKYLKILLNDTNVISIDSVVDSDGNDWYEVPYLAQDSIFVEVENILANSQSTYSDSQTPYLLKNQRVPKRFITRYTTDGKTELQFGSGITNNIDEEITPNPDNVGMMTAMGMSRLNYSWPLANFLYSDAYGQVPYNTTLTITYTVGGGTQANVLSKSITSIVDAQFILDDTGLDQTVLSAVKNSLACSNPVAASGGRDAESKDEIRLNALAFFAAQDRCVTKNDYIIRAMSMPAKFGSIAKAYITQDNLISNSELKNNPLSLDMYILSYDANKKLTLANNSIKENLITYLTRFKLLTDSINIKDAYIVNIGVNFDISVLPYFSGKVVMLQCIEKLKTFFDITNWQIKQPIVISDVYRELASVQGVQNITDIKFVNKFDTALGYSANVYNLTSAETQGIVYPSLDPSIFEIKYPDQDILGRIINQ